MSRDDLYSRVAVTLAIAAATLFVAGVVVIPLLQSAGFPSVGVGRLAYTPVCHQMAERSLTLGGHPLGVCARCTGLYLGGLIGLYAGFAVGGVRRRRPNPVWFAILAVPTLIDVALPFLGLEGLSSLPRLLLAVPPGVLAGLYLAIGIHDLANSRFSDRSRPSGRTDSMLEGLDG